MAIESYRDLIVWKEGIRLTLDIYNLTTEFPPNERYGLVSQMRRSAVSVPSNIAEGHARTSTKEYIRHISIALGSLAELETQLVLSREIGFLKNEPANQVLENTDRLGKQLRSLIKSLNSRLNRTRPEKPNS
jgi:four helix bundle protein